MTKLGACQGQFKQIPSTDAKALDLGTHDDANEVITKVGRDCRILSADTKSSSIYILV